MDSISGGMRQRAMIAMSLLLDPTLIVADEPTTGLDVIVQEQILVRIKEIQEKLKKTMLFVTIALFTSYSAGIGIAKEQRTGGLCEIHRL